MQYYTSLFLRWGNLYLYESSVKHHLNIHKFSVEYIIKMKAVATLVIAYNNSPPFLYSHPLISSLFFCIFTLFPISWIAGFSGEIKSVSRLMSFVLLPALISVSHYNVISANPLHLFPQPFLFTADDNNNNNNNRCHYMHLAIRESSREDAWSCCLCDVFRYRELLTMN